MEDSNSGVVEVNLFKVIKSVATAAQHCSMTDDSGAYFLRVPPDLHTVYRLAIDHIKGLADNGHPDFRNDDLEGFLVGYIMIQEGRIKITD